MFNYEVAIDDKRGIYTPIIAVEDFSTALKIAISLNRAHVHNVSIYNKAVDDLLIAFTDEEVFVSKSVTCRKI